MSERRKRKLKIASVPGLLAKAWLTEGTRTQEDNVEGIKDSHNANAGSKFLKQDHNNSGNSIKKSTKLHEASVNSENDSDSPAHTGISTCYSESKCLEKKSEYQNSKCHIINSECQNSNKSRVHKFWCDVCKGIDDDNNDDGGHKGSDDNKCVVQSTLHQKNVDTQLNSQTPAICKETLVLKYKQTILDTVGKRKILGDGEEAGDDREEAVTDMEGAADDVEEAEIDKKEATEDEIETVEDEEEARYDREKSVDSDIKELMVTEKTIYGKKHQKETPVIVLPRESEKQSRDFEKSSEPSFTLQKHKDSKKQTIIECEHKMCEWCKKLFRIGCPVLKYDLPKVYKNVLDEMKITLFKNDNQPSYCWIKKYLQQYPEMQSVIDFSSRAIANKKVLCYKDICSFFDKLSDYLVQNYGLNPLDFLSKRNASQVFTCNGTFFLLRECVSFDYCRVVLVPSENHFRKPLDKLLISGLFCVSALGDSIKPLFITGAGNPLKFSKLSDRDVDSYTLISSENGLLTGDIFFSWLTCVFHKYLEDNNVSRPVLLFLKATARNISVKALAFAEEHGIIVYCFPLHNAVLLQPLHNAIFKHLSNQCDYFVHESRKNSKAFGRAQWIKNFPDLVMQAYENAKVEEKAVIGFRDSGLLPFDPSQIQESACEGNFDQEDCQNKIFRTQELTETVKLQTPSVAKNSVQQKYYLFEDDLRAIYAAAYKSCQEDVQRRIEVYIPPTMLQDFRTAKNTEDNPGTSTLFQVWKEICKRPAFSIKQNASHQSSDELEKDSRKTPSDIHNLSKKSLEKVSSLPIAVVKLNKIEAEGRTEVDGGFCHDLTVEKVNEENMKEENDIHGEMEDVYIAPQCPVCFQEEKEGEAKKWVGCETCPSWYHKTCVGISLSLSNKEIKKLRFSCKYCVS